MTDYITATMVTDYSDCMLKGIDVVTGVYYMLVLVSTAVKL